MIVTKATCCKDAIVESQKTHSLFTNGTLALNPHVDAIHPASEFAQQLCIIDRRMYGIAPGMFTTKPKTPALPATGQASLHRPWLTRKFARTDRVPSTVVASLSGKWTPKVAAAS
jgi:hypothetical protein